MDRMRWKPHRTTTHTRTTTTNGTAIHGSHSSHRTTSRGGASSTTSSVVVVGTEAVASDQLTKNQKDFGYPPTGFCTKIEYTLLYSMISRPDVYPVAVLRDAIRTEDFSEYLWIVSSRSSNNNNSTNDGHQTNHDANNCSYAQLSAILGLAAEKCPPPDSGGGDSTATTNNVNSGGNVVLILCKALIHCVVRHAEEHELDREREVSELLVPLERVTLVKGRQTALAAVLPAYLGLGASILTGGNPIPFWIGYAMSINAVANQERDLANFRDIAIATTRQAHPETASLLTDDTDHD